MIFYLILIVLLIYLIYSRIRLKFTRDKYYRNDNNQTKTKNIMNNSTNCTSKRNYNPMEVYRRLSGERKTIFWNLTSTFVAAIFTASIGFFVAYIVSDSIQNEFYRTRIIDKYKDSYVEYRKTVTPLLGDIFDAEENAAQELYSKKQELPNIIMNIYKSMEQTYFYLEKEEQTTIDSAMVSLAVAKFALERNLLTEDYVKNEIYKMSYPFPNIQSWLSNLKKNGTIQMANEFNNTYGNPSDFNEFARVFIIEPIIKIDNKLSNKVYVKSCSMYETILKTIIVFLIILVVASVFWYLIVIFGFNLPENPKSLQEYQEEQTKYEQKITDLNQDCETQKNKILLYESQIMPFLLDPNKRNLIDKLLNLINQTSKEIEDLSKEVEQIKQKCNKCG